MDRNSGYSCRINATFCNSLRLKQFDIASTFRGEYFTLHSKKKVYFNINMKLPLQYQYPVSALRLEALPKNSILRVGFTQTSAKNDSLQALARDHY